MMPICQPTPLRILPPALFRKHVLCRCAASFLTDPGLTHIKNTHAEEPNSRLRVISTKSDTNRETTGSSPGAAAAEQIVSRILFHRENFR